MEVDDIISYHDVVTARIDRFITEDGKGLTRIWSDVRRTGTALGPITNIFANERTNAMELEILLAW